MKTIIIYDQCGQCSIEFAIVDGDKSHLNGVYLNGTGEGGDQTDYDALCDELSAIFYDSEQDDGIAKGAPERLPDFPVLNEPHKVIVCGFIP